MVGHTTYMCHCLNIGINVAHKYLIDEHEKYRQDFYLTLEEPAISGWKFELDKKGVTVKYPSLISARHNNDNTLGWITFSCRNCNSGDVYSVCRPDVDLSYPIDTTILSQAGGEVIVQKGTIFGKEIEKVSKSAAYSNTFKIVLSSDLPVNYDSLESDEDGSFNPFLLAQKNQVEQLIHQSLIDLKEATKKKIKIYQQEQEELLSREQNKVNYDGAVLWQSIKEIYRTINDEEKHTLKAVNAGHTVDRQQERAVGKSLENILGTETPIYESTNHHSQFRRRSSAFKRDLFGDYTAPPRTHRKSSYELDKSDLTKSLKKDTHPLDRSKELQTHSSTIKSIHPLAIDSPSLPEFASVNSHNPNQDNDIEKMEEPSLDNDNEDSEDMFALDEEMEEVDDDLSTSYDRRLSRRRSSAKYIGDDSSLDNADTIYLAPSKSTNLATSLPLSITPAYADSKMHPVNVTYHPSNPKTESTEKNAYGKTKRTSFVGFDSAEADRETSLLLPPLNENLKYRRKSSSAIAILKNKKGISYDSEQARRNTMMDLNFFNEDEEDVGGPMIPPHIFAANMVTDETEAMFGSLPQKKVRQGQQVG